MVVNVQDINQNRPLLALLSELVVNILCALFNIIGHLIGHFFSNGWF